ncbi:hypothetical protein Tsubulata_001763 [Turnera subulata]|uniref:non-specific serine/threonine protein kinase n=1 Tax=Turnera subulata TaxID=218843 RepID=A0A9Q0FIJ7_9ROSI|nr:hypothetical protein Tsubulata_001763 [Turnera subulata]
MAGGASLLQATTAWERREGNAGWRRQMMAMGSGVKQVEFFSRYNSFCVSEYGVFEDLVSGFHSFDALLIRGTQFGSGFKGFWHFLRSEKLWGFDEYPFERMSCLAGLLELEACSHAFVIFKCLKMEMMLTITLRMAVIAFALLLLVQSPRLSVSGLEIESKVCGADHIAYSNFLGHELFYINGYLVDEDSFCKALQHHKKDCVLQTYLESSSCYLDLSLAGLAVKHDRKLLQEKEIDDKSSIPNPGRNTPKENKDSSETFSTYTKAGIAATGSIFMACAFLFPCFYRKKKATSPNVLEKDLSSIDSASPFDVNNTSDKVPPSPLRVPPSPSRFSMSPKLSRLGSVHLNMTQVARATRNFSPSLQIGEGGFGTVYKAYLDDGQVVAIKRAKKEFFESLRTEFSSEVELLAKIDHRNLVKLLGYVDKGNERLIITEFVPNGTLREHLDGQRGKILDFNQRLEISIDVAHALTYLHLYAVLALVFRLYDEGTVVDLVDPLMEEIVDAEILRKMFSLAIQCAAPIRADRPDMKTVGEQLWGIRADYLKSGKRGK